MVDPFRTRLATLIVTRLTCPTPLVIRAWVWLAAQSPDMEEKRRRLLALLLFDQQRPTS